MLIKWDLKNRHCVFIFSHIVSSMVDNRKYGIKWTVVFACDNKQNNEHSCSWFYLTTALLLILRLKTSELTLRVLKPGGWKKFSLIKQSCFQFVFIKTSSSHTHFYPALITGGIIKLLLGSSSADFFVKSETARWRLLPEKCTGFLHKQRRRFEFTLLSSTKLIRRWEQQQKQ